MKVCCSRVGVPWRMLRTYLAQRACIVHNLDCNALALQRPPVDAPLCACSAGTPSHSGGL